MSFASQGPVVAHLTCFRRHRFPRIASVGERINCTATRPYESKIQTFNSLKCCEIGTLHIRLLILNAGCSMK